MQTNVQGVHALMSAIASAVQDTAVQQTVLFETLDAVQVCACKLPSRATAA